MDKILFVNACVREQSRTLKLAKSVLSRLEGEVSEVSLGREGIPVLDGAQLERRNGHLARGEKNADMLRYAVQFSQADTIVIAAPYWDLLFPALLKIYLEAVTVSGVTFYYTESGETASLCRARRLIYVTTSGGPMGEQDFGYQYISALAKSFYHIPELICVKAEGLDIVGADIPAIMERAKEQAALLLENGGETRG